MRVLRRIYARGKGGYLLMTIAMAMVFFLPLSQAQPSGQGFDHFQTGFPLTGLHARIECESCHMAGIFKGTPRQCKSCHARGSRINAALAPANMVHNLNQQVDCNSCHRTGGWTAARFEHMGISSGCLRCHRTGGGGQSAPVDNIHRQAMGVECSECHRSTDSFSSGALLDHSGFTSGCEVAGCHSRDKARARSHAALNGCQSCHNYPSWSNVRMRHSFIGSTQCRACHVRGGNAEGAPADQLHASIGAQDCSSCHSTSNFGSATINHSLITTGCGVSGCHAGDRISAPNHAGLSSCESCHRYPSWLSVTMDHGAIGATLCKSCHVAGGIGTAAPADQIHASIGNQDCSACHSTSTFIGGGVDHSSITAGCGVSGCHASDRASAPNHAGLSRCESCHRYPSWPSVIMDHNAIGATQCKSCHRQGGTAEGPPNDSDHSNISNKDCSDCHNTRDFD